MLMDSGYDSYQQVDLDAQAAAANPHQLVIMLIDGLLDEIERIRGHLAAKRLAEKGAGINKCMNILIGLTSALDDEMVAKLQRTCANCTTSVKSNCTTQAYKMTLTV